MSNTRNEMMTILNRDNSFLSLGQCLDGVNHTGGTRGKVSHFSTVSLWRMVSYLKSTVVDYKNMITLTYPKEYSQDGTVIKKHLDRFLRRLAESQESIVWFLEFQKRGAPHFHLFITNYVSKFEVAADWAWATGEWHAAKTMTRVEKMRAARHGIISYAIKYAAKSDQKEVPKAYLNVGRFWGVRGCRRVYGAKSKIKHSQGGDRLLSTLKGILKEGVETGEIKSIKWKYGDGSYYQLADRRKTWFSTDYARKIELAVSRHAIETGRRVNSTELFPQGLLESVEDGEIYFMEVE